MKACVLEAVGKLEYREAPAPRPGKGEVLLRVKACGICSSDIDRVFKTGTYHFPTVPGHEFAGQVVGLGEGVEPSYLGRRAAVFPLLPCFQCPSCRAGRYAMCDRYNYFGSRCDGAFAEYLAVPVWNLAFFSDELSYEAAAVCEPASVALHAVRTAGIIAGDTVAVVGSGTIGLLAAMWARIQGAGQVVVIGRGQKKLDAVRRLGFAHAVSSLEQDPEDAVKELTDGKGADAVLELAGNAGSIATAIGCARKGGTVVLTGNPAGDIGLDRNVYWQILRRELTLKGTWNSDYRGPRDDWETTLRSMERGMLQPEKLITHRFPLEQYEKAFQVLRTPDSGALKVMFILGAAVEGGKDE